MEEQNGWNESSRRYITEEPVFMFPNGINGERSQKQQAGSGGAVDKKQVLLPLP